MCGARATVDRWAVLLFVWVEFRWHTVEDASFAVATITVRIVDAELFSATKQIRHGKVRALDERANPSMLPAFRYPPAILRFVPQLY